MAAPNRLKPIDYFRNNIITSDDTYLYKIYSNLGGSLRRMPKSDPANDETLCAYSDIAAGFVPRNWLIMSNGTQLVMGVIGGQDKIYRSGDGGFSWTFLGDVAAGGLSANRTWAEASNGNVYFCEYDGPTANNRVGLWEISNNATVITEIHHWTIASVDHCHTVRFIDGYLYLGFGDLDAKCGIIRWDLIGDWSLIGDTSPKDINALGVSGFLGTGGTQKTRITDLVEYNGFLYTSADTRIDAPVLERGIFKLNKDLTNWVRVSGDIVNTTESTGYFGLNAGSMVLFVSFVEVSGVGVDNELYIWGSVDGETFERIGTYRTQKGAGNKVPLSFFEDSGKIYLCGSPSAGKVEQKGTAVMEIIDEPFKGPLPDVVHPAIWFSPAGSDSNSGHDPRTPKRNPAVAIRGSTLDADKAPRGAVLMLGSNDYEQTNCTYVAGENTSTYSTSDDKYLQLRGDGKGSTTLRMTANEAMFSQTASGESNLLFSDLKIQPLAMTSFDVFSGNASSTGFVVTQDCIIGDPEQTIGNQPKKIFVPRNEDTYKAYRCRIYADESGTADRYVSDTRDASGGNVELYSSIASGGEFNQAQGAVGNIKLYHSVVKKYTKQGLRQFSAGTAPIVKGSLIYSDNPDGGSQTPFRNVAANTWGAGNLDYNVVDITSSQYFEVTDAEIGANSLIDPTVGNVGALYADPANDDYTPTATNTVVLDQSYTKWGINGKLFGDTPKAGPFGEIDNPPFVPPPNPNTPPTPPTLTSPYSDLTITLKDILNIDITTAWAGATSYTINGLTYALEDVNSAIVGMVVDSGTRNFSIVAHNDAGSNSDSFYLQVLSGLPNKING